MLLVLAWAAGPGLADGWAPAVPLTIVAPANPGGGWDQTARLLQLALERDQLVSEPVEVVNQGGAGGTIGLAELVDSRRGDSHALMIGGYGMLGAVLMHGSRYTLKDVTPIARLTSEYQVIAVPAASPFKTLEDLLTAFKAAPESISWAGGSAGSADHIFIALLAERLGVDPARINYVAFTGGGDAATAVMGGQVPVGVSGFGEWRALAEAGRIRLLAVSAPDRRVSPALATLREQGIPLEFANWRSVFAPPGLTAEQRRNLIDLVSRARASRTWRDVLQQNGWQDSFLAGDAFGRFLDEESSVTQRALQRMGFSTGVGHTTVGAWFFPGLALFAMAASLLVLAVQARRAGPIATAATDAAPAHELRSALLPVCIAAAALFAYAAALWRIGFLVATPVFIFGFLYLSGSRRWRRDAAFAVVMTVVTLAIFQLVLGVKLP